MNILDVVDYLFFEFKRVGFNPLRKGFCEYVIIFDHCEAKRFSLLMDSFAEYCTFFIRSWWSFGDDFEVMSMQWF